MPKLDSMEMEALRRAQEMHRSNSSQQRVAPTPSPSANRRKGEASPSPTQSTKSNSPSDTPHTSDTSFGVLDIKGGDNLFEDKEKLLILLLIMVLSSEGHSDPTLILALLYLII